VRYENRVRRCLGGIRDFDVAQELRWHLLNGPIIRRVAARVGASPDHAAENRTPEIEAEPGAVGLPPRYARVPDAKNDEVSDEMVLPISRHLGTERLLSI